MLLEVMWLKKSRAGRFKFHFLIVRIKLGAGYNYISHFCEK